MTTGPDAEATLNVKHVLVPLDGSELALQAIPTATVLSARLGAQLHTIGVAPTREAGEALRASTIAVLGDDFDADRALIVVEDNPADAIERRARELGTCLVCLTTRGRGRLAGAVLGSVARTLLHRLPDGIIALGPEADNPGWAPRPRDWPDPLSTPRIVVCVDGTSSAEQVLPTATAWARSLDMSLTILSISTDRTLSFDPAGTANSDAAPGIDEYVAGLVERCRNDSPDLAIDGLVFRDPVSLKSGIRSYLDARPAGLVALATHARSGLDRAKFGASGANIVESSTAPCLVVPVN